MFFSFFWSASLSQIFADVFEGESNAGTEICRDVSRIIIARFVHHLEMMKINI